MTDYVKQEWHNEPATDTPISAERLSHMEDGIAAALTEGTLSSLARWRRKLGEAPAKAKIVLSGDSTTQNATALFERLAYHTAPGRALAGVATANILNRGYNGITLATWLNDPTKLAELVADKPDLIIPAFGINDMRTGGTTPAQMLALVERLVATLTAAIPTADILLRIPNSLTTTVVGTDYVDGISHQDVTDTLRLAYLAQDGRRQHVLVADSQANVFGTSAFATTPLMQDELHPNDAGNATLSDFLVSLIGKNPPRPANIAAPHHGFYRRTGQIVAAGNGYIDIANDDRAGEPASTWAPTTSDILYVAGIETPLSLSGMTFVTNGSNLRILKSGNYAGYVGKACAILGTHAYEGLRTTYRSVSFDPGSIPAGGTLDVAVAVPGATGENGVTAQPDPNILSHTGIIWSVFVSANDTVTVRFFNATTAAVDMPSRTWRFWLAR